MSSDPNAALTLAGPSSLLEMVAAQKRGEPRGVWSCCSANPFVLEACLRDASARGTRLLVEATSNQVNQEGGYTGITPAEFAASLRARARDAGLPGDLVLFGGDHLGPHPWHREPAAQAMEKAREMVRHYVRAGAAKIHLDASMNLGGDPPGALDDATGAERTADLCAAAESARPAGTPGPVYVIGTEVPPPGGERADSAGPVLTRPDHAARTLERTRAAFRSRGLDAAWDRVIALVVQPGVEFGDEGVHEYDAPAARALTDFVAGVPGIVYEAHSTDYQTAEGLAGLVRDHFAILKVGPWLTFAFREAVFALAAMEEEWLGRRPGVTLSRLPQVVEEVMERDPVHWREFYRGDEARLRFARRFSFSDRIRYYWPRPEVQAALARLITNLESHPLPWPLLSQHLPGAYRAVREQGLAPQPRELVRFHIGEVIDVYARACGTADAAPDRSTPR
jgi:D-tagatose-1,6-bisphosphate aldolase subunit GatZ/KbaZ